MSDILKRLTDLEREFMDSCPLKALPDQWMEFNSALRRHTMLIARAVVVDEFRRHAGEIGLGTLFNDSAARATAALRFPLPPRKVLREEPLPGFTHGPRYRWRDGIFEWTPAHNEQWEPLKDIQSRDLAMLRHAVDLADNPYREEAE